MVLADLMSQKSMKVQIIEILSREFPLTARKVYNKIIKKGISVTYHGVYDCMQDMVKKGILLKNGTSYTLSNKWVVDTCIIMEKIRVRQTIGPMDLFSSKGSSEVLKFESYSDFSKFLIDFGDYFVENCIKTEDNIIYWITDHMIVGTLTIMKNADTFKKMKEKNIKHRSLVSGNTPLDEFVKALYCSVRGIDQMKTGIRTIPRTTVGVYNDMVLQIIMPPKIIKTIDKIYNSTKNCGNDFSKISQAIKKLSEFLETKKFKIQVVISKDPELAKEYREYVDGYFKKQRT